MATNFGPDVTQMPALNSAQTPTQGVVEDPTLLRGLGNMFEQAGAALKKDREGKAVTAVSGFTQKQLLVAEALDQGRIRSSAHARTLMRRNLMEAIDMNPALASEYIKAQASIIGLPGGADIASKGTQEEQDMISRRSGLVNAGLLSFDADDATFRQTDSMIRTAEEASRQHKMRIETLDEELKMQNVSDGRRKQIEAEKEQAGVDFVRAAAPAEFARAQSQFDQILNSNASEAEKLQALDDFWSSWQNELSATLGDVGSHRASSFMKPFEDLYASYKLRATGELTDAELKRDIDRHLSTQKALAVSNPDIARLAVTSELFGQSGLVEVLTRNTPAFQAYVDFLASGSPNNERPPAPVFTKDQDTRDGLKAYLDSITSGFREGGPAAEEAAAHLGSVLESVQDYEGLLRRDPAAGIEIVNWMASSAFLEARRSNPELFESADELREILERNYDNEVWGLVRREFTNNSVVIETPNEHVVPRSQGGTGEFELENIPSQGNIGARSTPNGVEFYALDPNNREFVAEASRLNKELKPIINNTLKAGAHLEGRTDYGQVWEEVASEFLGVDAETLSGTTGGGLVLDDFIEKATPLVNLANSGTLMNLMDRHEGAGDYDTLFGHSQRQGNAFSGVRVSQMTIAEASRFSQGEYARWSRGKLGYTATPMGRYQIVGTTLRDTARKMGLSPDTKFDQRTQDAMFGFLANQALAGKSSMPAKRRALRGVWEGFKHVPDAQLDQAIREFEAS